jgi:NADPH:quinone reductase
VNVAAEQGATVIATTRRPDRAVLLQRIGATTVLIDDGRLADQQTGVVDCIFDLVGNSVLRDSLRIVRPRGRVCQLGFLGGLVPIAGFNPIADLPSGVQLSFYGSAFVLGTAEFPLAEIPLTERTPVASNRSATRPPSVRMSGSGRECRGSRR